MTTRRTKRRALVCSYYAPQTDRDTGSRRVMELIECLREQGWEVGFVAVHPDGGRYERALHQRGVSVHDGASLDALLQTTHWDLAVLAYWPVAERFLPIIRRHSPATRVVVDSIDLHFLRDARQLLVSDAGMLDPEYGHEFIGELNTYAAADAVLTVSDKEAALVDDLVGASGLAWAVPVGEPPPEPMAPCGARQGSVFLGNFQHAPNVDAVEFLCREVLPLVDASLLARHPVWIVGSGMSEHVRRLGQGIAGVRMVGWVPDVEPYLRRARVALLPLRHGAGVKGKLIEAMRAGTPAVSTSIGAEGMEVRDGVHVLVADSAGAFASALQRLLTDDVLWTRLARAGQAQMKRHYSRTKSRRRFVEVVSAVLRKPVTPVPPPAAGASQYAARLAYQEDRRIMPAIRQAVRQAVPEGATVAVLSDGRAAHLRLPDRVAWHVPDPPAGTPVRAAGAESTGMVEALESMRAKGAGFLLVPRPSLHRIEYDRSLAEYLTHRCVEVLRQDGQCRIFRFGAPEPRVALPTPPQASVPPALQPRRSPRPRVLVVGVYLADQENAVDAIVANLRGSTWCRVTQRWAALGASPAGPDVAAVTVLRVREKTPKFSIVNRLLEGVDLRRYDYVLMTDDDVAMPESFLDGFIAVQQGLQLAMAQPARTSTSSIDHPIVEQQRGVAARRTQFVEIGPVVSFHRSVFPLVLPFDLTSGMGWGYENVWAHRLRDRGLRMGIVDAVPVEHSMRPTLAHYGWAEGDAGRTALLARHPHLPLDECMRVLEVVPLDV